MRRGTDESPDCRNEPLFPCIIELEFILTASTRPGLIPLWLVLLGLLTAIAPLSVDMYLPAFPAIAGELGSDSASVQLTLAVFLAGLACGQLLYGPLSDRYGRKPPLYVGLVLYVIASVACALSESVTGLIGWRFAQALGGSAGIVISRAVIRDRSTTEEAARAFSLLMLVMGVAPILAPLLGSLLLILAGWRAMFWLLGGFGLFLLVAVFRSMEETVPREVKSRGGIVNALRVYRDLLRDRRLLCCALTGAVLYGGMFAYIAGSPYVLIDLHRVPVGYFGWLFGFNAFGLIAASQINARLVVRLGPVRMLRRAIWIPAVSASVGLVAVLAGVESLVLVMAVLFSFLTSMGFITANAMALALAEQGRRAGAAAAVIGASQFLFGTLGGIAVSVWHLPSEVPLFSVLFLVSVVSWLLHRLGAEPAMAATTASPPSRG